MFSNRVCVSSTRPLVLSELKSADSLTTDPIQVHGVSLSFVFVWQAETGRIKWTIGLCQPPNVMVGLVVQGSLVFQSSSARLRRSFEYLLSCTDAINSTWFYFILPSQIKLLAEDGTLKMSAHLEVFEPIPFRNISPAAMYSIHCPTESRAILGVDDQGTVYLLRSLSIENAALEQWGVYSFRPCNPDRGVILARLRMRQLCFKGSGFDRENKQLAVTQIYDNNNSLQLDVLDWASGHHTTRIYNMNQDQDLEWSAAAPHKQGWLCIASGVREGPRMVYHRFWLLCDDGQLKLATELIQATPCGLVETAASLNGKFYCLVVIDRWRYLVFVSSWEQPSMWQPYEMAPYPDFFTYEIYCEWGHILVYGRIFSGPKDKPTRQDALFKLRFEGADCYLEPYLILPKGVVNWKIGINGFVTFAGGEKLTLFGMEPPALKTRALQDVVKLLNGEEKLTQILGKATNAIRT